MGRSLRLNGLLKSQKEYVKAVDTHKFTGYVGGYRSGKSKGNLPRYTKLSSKRHGDVKLLMIAPTYQLLRDVNVAQFQEWLVSRKIPHHYSKSEFRMEIGSPIRGEVLFRAGENPDRIVGFEVTDFIIDEFDLLKFDTQKKLWEKCIARISGASDGTGAVTTTPEGFKYTYELFESQKIGKLIRADTRDNFYLSDEYIKTLLTMYDEKLVMQYIKGEFVSLTGIKAYYAYLDREEKILDLKGRKMNMPDIYVGMDFNVDPMTATICYFTGRQLFVIDEIFLRNTNTSRMIEVIKSKYKGKNVYVAPDMTGNRLYSSAPKHITDIKLLIDAGFHVLGKGLNPFQRDRITAMNLGFTNNMIKVSPGCKELIKDFKTLETDAYGEIVKEDPLREHMSTNLGYLFWRLLGKQLLQLGKLRQK